MSVLEELRRRFDSFEGGIEVSISVAEDEGRRAASIENGANRQRN